VTDFLVLLLLSLWTPMQSLPRLGPARYVLRRSQAGFTARIQMKGDALLRAPPDVRCALFAFHSSHLFIACGARRLGDTLPRQTYKALSCRLRCHSSGILPPTRLQLFYYTHMRFASTPPRSSIFFGEYVQVKMYLHTALESRERAVGITAS
jgi:hypothetical protein